jgi:uncharacterized protein YndB with AHSA1/START domain
MTSLPPIRREILVDGPAELAFRVFTDGIGGWWPLETFSVFGADATVSFDDGEIVELSPTGERSVWGTVTDWQPGERVAFTWHPGRDADKASQVAVTFTANDDKTLVALERSGWEVFADPEGARAEYDKGWPMVLGRYAGAVVVPKVS